jgi:hypothetical protein
VRGRTYVLVGLGERVVGHCEGLEGWGVLEDGGRDGGGGGEKKVQTREFKLDSQRPRSINCRATRRASFLTFLQRGALADTPLPT